MLEELLEALAPLALEAIGLLVTLIVGWLAVKVNGYLAIAGLAKHVQIEEKHLTAIRSGILNGVQSALNRGLTPQEAVEEGIDHVKRAFPDAVRSLAANDGALREIAEAKVEEWLGIKAGTIDRVTDRIDSLRGRRTP